MILDRTSRTLWTRLMGRGCWSRSQSTVAAKTEDKDGIDPAEEWERAKPFDRIPGARAVPILGSVWAYLPIIGTPMDLSRQMEFNRQRVVKYGPISREIIPKFPPIVFTTRPEDAEKLFRTEGRYPVRPGFDSLKRYREKRTDHFSAAGILMASGEPWWQIRSKAQKPLLKTKNINNYLPVIGEIADEFIDRIRLIRLENQEMSPDFINELYKWALESVAVVALDVRLGCLSPSFSAHSDAQKMIRAASQTFASMAKLELEGFPFYKFVETKTLRQLFAAQDIFTE